MNLNTTELDARLATGSSLPEEETSFPRSPDDITTQPIEIDPEKDAKADQEFNKMLKKEIKKRSDELPPVELSPDELLPMDVVDKLRADLPEEKPLVMPPNSLDTAEEVLARESLTDIQKAIFRGQEYVNPFEMSDKEIKERLRLARENLKRYHQIDPFERPETRFSSGKILGGPDIDAQRNYASA